MLSSVKVIYLRINCKLIPVFFISNTRKEIMYWDGSGNILKLKNNFLQESLLLQPIMILIIFVFNLKIFIVSGECSQNNKS